MAQSNPIGKSYDAVVVGAGNGGLAAAAQLAAKGVKTLLLEQHNLPGGFASSFVRGRFEFESAMHLVADVGWPGDKGGVRKFLEDDLGIFLDWVEIPEAYRLCLTDPREKLDVTIPYGLDPFINAVVEAVPGSREVVTNYVNLFNEVVDAVTYLGESRGNPDKKVLTSRYANFLKTAPYTVDQVANAMKVPRRARDIIHALWVYLGPSTDRLNFTVFAAMMAKLLRYSGFIPHHRSHEFTASVEARFRELGGESAFMTRVEQILVENGQVVGVVTSHGDRIATKHVVSNASPTLVYNRLIAPKAAVPEIALRECQARVPGTSAATVYLGLDASPDELGLDAYSFLVADSMDTKAMYETFKTVDAPRTQATSCLNRALPECSPPGTTILAITTLYTPDAWKNVRPEDYFKTKNRVAKDLIAHFEQGTGARIMDHVEEVEVATPATFAHYTGVHGGTIYAYEPEPWDSLIPRMMAMNEEKHIQGLEFCGGHVFRCHGYSSSFMSGQTVALLTLRSLMEERG